jgi:hypothetical protein
LKLCCLKLLGDGFFVVSCFDTLSWCIGNILSFQFHSFISTSEALYPPDKQVAKVECNIQFISIPARGGFSN